MILDEPLTAMIPPPDLWGSTGYTANNNKVGLKRGFKSNQKMFPGGRGAKYFTNISKKIKYISSNQKCSKEGEEQEEGWSKVCSARSQEVSQGFVTRPISHRPISPLGIPQ